MALSLRKQLEGQVLGNQPLSMGGPAQTVRNQAQKPAPAVAMSQPKPMTLQRSNPIASFRMPSTDPIRMPQSGISYQDNPIQQNSTLHMARTQASKTPLLRVSGAAPSPQQKPKNVIDDLVGIGKDIGSSLQQGVGSVVDVALQGGAVLGTFADDVNPSLSKQQKDAALQSRLKNTEILRKVVHSQKDISGNTIDGTSRADEAGANIARGNFSGQDVATVAGAGLNTGLAATAFINPASGAMRAIGGNTLKNAAIASGKEALLYGGVGGTATGLDEYGRTGNIEESLKAGALGAATSGALQFGLGIGGHAAGKGIKYLSDPNTQFSSRPGFAKIPSSKNAGKEMPQVARSEQLSQPTPQQQKAKSVQDQAAMMQKDDYPHNRLNHKVALDSSMADSPLAYRDSIPFDSSVYVKDRTKAAKIARGDTVLDKAVRLKDELYTKTVDYLHPIESKLSAVKKSGIDINPQNDISPQLDRALRSDMIASQYIRDNGFDKLIQSVPDTKAFDQYLIAKHALEWDSKGLKTGRNLESDKMLINQLAPQYEPYAQNLYKYSQNLLDKTVDYGLINPEVASHLKATYPNYVPFDRIFSEVEQSAAFKGKGGISSVSTQNVVQKAKGSSREIDSPLASLLTKTQDVIARGERNKAARILASYKDLPGNPFGLRELKASETVGTKSTIAFMENGKTRRFETTPEIAAAAKALNEEQMNVVTKMLAVPTRVLRLGATGINVGFTLANVVKDMVGAAVNSKHPIRSLAATKDALVAAGNHKSSQYAELMREGAGGTSFDIGRDVSRGTIDKIRSGRSVTTSALYTVTHPGDLVRSVENLIGRSEEFGRASQYFGNKKAALDMGMSSADAKIYGADAARWNSTNFARHGEFGLVVNSTIPYLNAGIQGARILMRNLKERPAQTTAKIAVLAVLPSTTTTLWNLADPSRKAAYDEISDYEKEGNLIIIPPNPTKDEKTGKWNVIKIPINPGLQGVSNIARNTVEAGRNDAEFNVIEALTGLIGTATSINVGSPRQLVNQVTPQALKPVIEATTNQNLYTGNKIIPDSQKNLPASEQYGQYTSGTAMKLGEMFNMSPRMIDNAIRTTTGGAGQNAINFSDSMLAASGAIPQERVQGKPLLDSVTGRFYGASAKNPYDVADTKFNEYKNQMIDSPEYKAASQDERAKMLNRLERDTKAAVDDPSKLSSRQQSLAGGSVDSSAYTSSAKAKGKTYAEKYQSALSEMKSPDSAKWSPIERTKKQKNLKYLTVQKDFADDTVSLYNMAKSDVYGLVAGDPNGKKYVEDILKYGDALVAAGLSKTNKFRDKYGNVALNSGTSSGAKRTSSRRSGSGRKKSAKGKFDYKLTGFSGTSGTSTSTSLRQLLKKAKIRQGIA